MTTGPRRDADEGSDLDGRDLIGLPQDLQEKEGYLSEPSLHALARRTGRSLVDLYAAATFYRDFSLKPRGRHVVSVCTDTACHMRGAVRTDSRRVQGLPLAPRAPHKQDPIHTPAVVRPRPATAKPVGVHVLPQERLDLRPQLVRHPVLALRSFPCHP
jgi:hypothetical protein